MNRQQSAKLQAACAYLRALSAVLAGKYLARQDPAQYRLMDHRLWLSCAEQILRMLGSQFKAADCATSPVTGSRGLQHMQGLHAQCHSMPCHRRSGAILFHLVLVSQKWLMLPSYDSLLFLGSVGPSQCLSRGARPQTLCLTKSPGTLAHGGE